MSLLLGLTPPLRTLATIIWGGGISLALGLLDAMHPDLFVPMTFAVVLFSAVAQGLTLKRLLGWLKPGADQNRETKTAAGSTEPAAVQ